MLSAILHLQDLECTAALLVQSCFRFLFSVFSNTGRSHFTPRLCSSKTSRKSNKKFPFTKTVYFLEVRGLTSSYIEYDQWIRWLLVTGFVQILFVLPLLYTCILKWHWFTPLLTPLPFKVKFFIWSLWLGFKNYFKQLTRMHEVANCFGMGMLLHCMGLIVTSLCDSNTH